MPFHVKNVRIPDHATFLGSTWRPWGVDALARVVSTSPTGASIRYDHAPTVSYALSGAEFMGGMGRVVSRSDYLKGQK